MENSAVTRLIYFGTQHKPNWITDHCKALPKISRGQVLVRVRLATICSSDLHTISGRRKEPLPSVLGHEAVCEIVQDNREPIARTNTLIPSIPLPKGTRVTFGILVSCSECSICRLGCPQKCKNLFKYGHSSTNDKSGFNGCYATHIVLREKTPIIPIPPEISDHIAAPANCALATAVNAIEQARTNSSNRVALVQGAGILGLYACALLHHKGYERVICCDIDIVRLKMCEKFGGESCLKYPPEERDFADCVIESCGSSSVLQDGMSAIRYGGVYVWAGMVHPNSKLSITGEDVVRKCITIKGVHNYQARHLQEAVDFLKETYDTYPFEELLSEQSYHLSEFESALQVANAKTFHRVSIKP